jgi:hypothetical protein
MIFFVAIFCLPAEARRAQAGAPVLEALAANS